MENSIVTTNLTIPELRKMFDSQLVAPGDATYDISRASLYGGFDYHPAMILRPTHADQVAQVVNLARQSGLELAIRSGGHSLAGHSLSHGGIVLDLVNMQSMQIDRKGSSAWAQSGSFTGKSNCTSSASSSRSRLWRRSSSAWIPIRRLSSS